MEGLKEQNEQQAQLSVLKANPKNIRDDGPHLDVVAPEAHKPTQRA